MNYNNYPSIGIDHKIKILQNVLATSLGFNTVDFYGRTLRGIDKNGDSLSPEVMISSTESKEVYYDDAKAIGGNVFFIDANDHITKDGIMFTAKIKIVFMLNLNKIKSEPITDAQAHDIAVKQIQKTRSVTITGLEKGLDNVLNDFNTENIKLQDTRPFHIFAVTADLNYTFNCNN
ncbi:hypothetical protein [Flavobacterium sp. UMI-01]|uniref:hypothetical protein n=1 Tax=Flavobacterium sp. UMI-01 TaxID=1441053 RepID=UPI001C7E1036|nr:hypothetical protein [Flavobacterium sp. UMI-01]GIZ08374.1 hypothetical protein FUMI01_11010 [Flavobacterium sp. UMI-01]